MSIKEFKLDRKAAGAQALEGLWGPGPPADLLFDMAGVGKGNHGTRVGAGNVWTPSERGIVSQFNGVDDAWNTERALGIDLATFTICAWAYLDSTVPQAGACIGGQGAAGADEWMLQVVVANGADAAIRFFGDGGTISCQAAGASYTPVKNTWAHLAFSRGAGGVGRLYQDGILMQTDATSAANLNTVKVLQIGNADTGATRWWKGMIDDVRHYSRALSIAEITHIYNATRWTPYADIALGRIRRHGRHQWGHVRRVNA